MNFITGEDFGPERPWWTCVLPFVVFLAAGVLEPTVGGGGLSGALGIPYGAYPFIYTLRLAATLRPGVHSGVER